MPFSAGFFYILTSALITSSHLSQGPPILHPEVSPGDLAHPLAQAYSTLKPALRTLHLSPALASQWPNLFLSVFSVS